jgi:hypothetical protein
VWWLDDVSAELVGLRDGHAVPLSLILCIVVSLEITGIRGSAISRIDGDRKPASPQETERFCRSRSTTKMKSMYWRWGEEMR